MINLHGAVFFIRIQERVLGTDDGPPLPHAWIALHGGSAYSINKSCAIELTIGAAISASEGPQVGRGIHRRRLVAQSCSVATTGGMAYVTPMAASRVMVMKLDDGSFELSESLVTGGLLLVLVPPLPVFRRARPGHAGTALLRVFACATRRCGMTYAIG